MNTISGSSKDAFQANLRWQFMDFIEALNWRYAAKRMNGQTIPSSTLNRILEAAWLSPSSFGVQPYSILVIDNIEVRQKLKREAAAQPQVEECSHLLVFAVWKSVSERHVDDLIKLTADLRGLDRSSLEEYGQMIKSTINGFATKEECMNWAARQAYLALGVALSAAAMEQVDATPMEGFNPELLDECLGLETMGLKSVSLLALGFRCNRNDWLAGMKKVRWPKEEVIRHLT